MKKLIIAGLVLGLLAGCVSTESKSEAKDKPVQNQEGKKEESKKEQEKKKSEGTPNEIVSYAKKIKGATFIKDIKVANNEAEILFYDSYESYQSENPKTKIAKGKYTEYFKADATVAKILVGEPARLLKQFSTLNKIKMVLPFEGKTYSINLDRTSLNSYIGFKIEDLKSEDKSWTEKFYDPYVNTADKRAAFFAKFVIVQ